MHALAQAACSRLGASPSSAHNLGHSPCSSSMRQSSRHAAPTPPPRASSSGITDASPASWVKVLADRLPPRFPDAPETYWRGVGSPGTALPQVHGDDSILGALHDAGVFTRPRLMVDEGGHVQRVMLSLRTGARTAGHPGWTHGGLTSLLMDEIAGQAYAHFVQTERGLGMTANLTVNYSAPLPTCKDLLVVAGVEKVDGRKVTIHVEVRDGPPNECVLGDGKDDDCVG